MIIFDIDNKEYTLEFSFDAAENKDIVQKMFDYMTGAYIYKESGNTRIEDVRKLLSIIKEVA